MLKKFIAPYLLLCILSNGLLGQSTPESLTNIIQSHPRDTNQLNSIYKEVSLPESNKDSTYDPIVQKFITAAERIGWINGVVKGCDLAGNRLYNRGKFIDALPYFEKIAKLAQRQRVDSDLHANAYKMIAGIFFNTGQPEQAIENARYAINLFWQTNDTQSVARTTNLLGGIYWNMGKLDLASEKIYEALKLREQLGDTLGMAHAYNNIGLIYDSQGKINEALEMYHKALNIYIQQNNDLGIGRACNNIATILKNQRKYNESLEMFLKSYEIDLKRNNIDDQGKTLSNIGELYLELGNVNQAIDYFNKAIKTFTKSSNDNGLAAIYLNIGNAYEKSGNIEKAKHSYIDALKIAQKIYSTQWQRDAHKNLYSLLKKQGNYSKALEHLELYKTLDDTLRNLANLNEMDRLKIEYETEKKENKIKLLQKERDLSQLNLKRQRTANHFLISIVASFLIILTLSIIYLNRLKADIALLQAKNIEIHNQKEEIEAQRDMLEINLKELNQHKAELEAQSEFIEKQNQLLFYTNHRITEGLEYASMIQKSLMSNPQDLNNYFRQQAMLYKPKDYVGGDFYWHHLIGDEVIFAVADCTGHGVAGAFMSITAVIKLKDAVSHYGMTSTHEIATHLYNELLRDKTNPFDSNVVIGIDFLVCRYNPKTKVLEFAGNKIAFEIINGNHQKSFKPNRKGNKELGYIEFYSTKVTIEPGSRLYFYTDGYPDQLSEVKRKKLGRTELVNLLTNSVNMPLDKQIEHLNNFIEKYQGSYEQVDDMLILALEV